MSLLGLLIAWTCGLGKIYLFDWDEINFALIASEMLQSGNYLQPTVGSFPFHEKPPLFAWVQLLSFKALGVNEFAARLPNVLCGGLTLILLYHLGRRSRGREFGIWWAAFLGASILPGLYYRSGIIDPWFNLFIFAALWPLAARGRLTAAKILISGLVLGLAVLTKGPAAGLIAGLVCATLLIVRPERRVGRSLSYLCVGLLSLLPAAIWLALLWKVDDGFFAREFLTYQWRLFLREDAGHGGFPGYHFVVLLFGCFPASVFALRTLWKRSVYASPAAIGMRILFWVVLILFSVVNTKIVHYSSLCYFPLAWFAARRVTEREPETQPHVILLRPIWIIYGVVAALLPLVAMNLDLLLPYLEDAELLSRLELPVSWPWYTLLPALLVLIALVLERIFRPDLRRLAAGSLLLALLFSVIGVAVFAPRIQSYSQGAAVEFYQNIGEAEVYVGTAYYKSYVPWFYGAGSLVQGPRERRWRFHGPIDRPLYFSSPLRKTEQVLREVPDAELLYQKGGFSFYRRP